MGKEIQRIFSSVGGVGKWCVFLDLLKTLFRRVEASFYLATTITTFLLYLLSEYKNPLMGF